MKRLLYQIKADNIFDNLVITISALKDQLLLHQAVFDSRMCVFPIIMPINDSAFSWIQSNLNYAFFYTKEIYLSIIMPSFTSIEHV